MRAIPSFELVDDAFVVLLIALVWVVHKGAALRSNLGLSLRNRVEGLRRFVNMSA
jgi:hypothetical protein